MSANSRLSIAISTYNRSLILYENLKIMLPELKKNLISVYISDDSTDGNTKPIIQELMKEYPYLYYRQNQPKLGHDANFCSGNLEMSPLSNLEMSPFGLGETTLLKGRFSRGRGHELRGSFNYEHQRVKALIGHRKSN